MPFDRAEVETLLVACQRCCCICHRFCGTTIETDHMVPAGEGGSDDISNAMPVCFDCHADIHTYNPQHPRGRRFTPEELRLHRSNWLEACRNAVATGGSLPSREPASVGALQALIDEIEFNRVVAAKTELRELGCPFRDDQFRRAIHDGAISVLRQDLKDVILEAYSLMGAANEIVAARFSRAANGSMSSSGSTHPVARVEACGPKGPRMRKSIDLSAGQVDLGSTGSS